MEGGYQQMLRQELLDRIKRNSSYSARAMARDLGMSPSYFCQVLNRSRRLTENRAFDVADRLGWDPDKARRFVTWLKWEKAADEPSRRRVLAELKECGMKEVELYGLEVAYFETMSSWIHYAVLELTTVQGFVPKADWIARKLGLTIVETEMAIRRLRSLGLLVSDGDRWAKAHAAYSTPDDHPAYAGALRRFHDGVMQLARRKLWEDQGSREFGSIVVATDPGRIPELKRRIRKFQQEMMAFMEQAPAKAVYQMSIQLFRLDREEAQ